MNKIMKLKFKLSIVPVFIIILFLTGCATSRSVIDVPLPVSERISKSNGKEIYINSVTDERLFQIKPAEPNIPSLDPSEVQGDEIKLRAIARKRNSYGMALGDILLIEGKTVNLLIDATLRQAFIESGYKVISSKEQITNNTYIVDAKIIKLWSWMNPGFLAITLSADISTDIAIESSSAVDRKIITVKESDTFQSASESNWREVMQNALKTYIAELKLKL